MNTTGWDFLQVCHKQARIVGLQY
jgi:hypothetical protein